ncbi:MAG TPA: type VI secretion system-associated protein TagF, partial [Telluria sp.]|nr:type VI secretion system-associated protein TagF [Telluria sp.]
MKPAHRIGYFGKLPTRGDFVRSPHEGALLAVLDEWLADVMSELPADVRWKLHFDALAPVHFAFVGLRRRQAIGGHLVSSRDQAGRRFPFLLARTVDVAEPGGFVAESPLIFAPVWSVLATVAHSLACANDPAPLLERGSFEQAAPATACRTALDALLDTCTVGALSALLGREDIRRLVLAVGIVLRPVMRIQAEHLEKSLVLPLPENASARSSVAAFWLELVVPFLAGRDVELSLFLTRIDGAPVLVIGFAGACARTLQAIIDPALGAQLQVAFAETGWVDACDTAGIDVR